MNLKTSIIRLTLCCLYIALSANLSAQNSIPLYPEAVPHALVDAPQEKHTENDILWITEIRTPTIEVYLPPKRHQNKKAVIILPGGGYHGLAYDLEGIEIAKWYNTIGYTAFVLKYRTPERHTGDFKNKIPLSDAVRAIKYIRKNADRWSIDPHNIGIMGFSAGGHLASTLGTHYDMEVFPKSDPYHEVSARPDFMVLIYPVISMEDAYTHKGSKLYLLGEKPSKEAVHLFSNNKQVNSETPPTFLIHCEDDNVVPVANSIMMFQALKENDIDTELHVFPKGGHGFGLGITNSHISIWPTLLERWLHQLDEK